MIEVAAAGNAGMMAGLLDRMSGGRVAIYSGTRPSTATLVTTVYLAEPAGVVGVNGDLALAVGVQSVVVNASAPTWGRVANGLGEHLFDCDVRLSSAADTGQEIVLATTTLVVGALVQIQSGTFSTMP